MVRRNFSRKAASVFVVRTLFGIVKSVKRNKIVRSEIIPANHKMGKMGNLHKINSFRQKIEHKAFVAMSLWRKKSERKEEPTSQHSNRQRKPSVALFT